MTKIIHAMDTKPKNTQGVSRCRKSKDRQYNNKKEKERTDKR